MPNKKKGKKSRAKGGAAASGAPKAPRHPDEIIGKYGFALHSLQSNQWKTSVIKKQVARELYDAVCHEANSDERKAIVDKLEAIYLDPHTPPDQSGFFANQELMPVTYETEEMVAYPKRCLLTVGKRAPFIVEKEWHDRPERARVQINDEDRAKACRWTGEEPVVNCRILHLNKGEKDAVVFLGDCFLDKEDVVNFACMFRKGAGGSTFNWPNCYACLQCPFCCKIAVPHNGDAPRQSYVMIVQFIRQMTRRGGTMVMPTRALPRLCCKECFARNLGGIDGEIPQEEQPPWCRWPEILRHGIVYNVARNVMGERLKQRLDDHSFESHTVSAWSLFDLWDLCGMCAAVTEVLEDKAMAQMQTTGLPVTYGRTADTRKD